MFNLHDVVRLKKFNKELCILPSYLGTIVDVCNNGEAYTVEFIDDNNETIEAALFIEFKGNELERVYDD